MRQAMVRATRKAARSSGGRPVRADNLHVTLAFLGSVPERRLRELGDVAREAAEGAGPAVELSFDRLEHWRAAHIICASPAEPPMPVAILARKLQELLVGRGFIPGRKSPRPARVNIIMSFRPHVTLARKVHRLPGIIEMQPVTWSFRHFVLVDSRTLPEGAIYTVLQRFPLDR